MRSLVVTKLGDPVANKVVGIEEHDVVRIMFLCVKQADQVFTAAIQADGSHSRLSLFQVAGRRKVYCYKFYFWMGKDRGIVGVTNHDYTKLG